MPSLADLVRMGKQYVSDALPGGSLNPETQPVADQARYISGVTDPDNSQIGRDLQAWHRRTQAGLADQLAGNQTPEADYAYQQVMNMAGVAPVGMMKVIGPQHEAFRLAQQRAALPVEKGGLGLPANNTPQMRADAMFPDTVYHGSKTPEGITELLPGGVRGSVQTGDAYGSGVYTSTDRLGDANSYGAQGAVFPLRINRGNHLNIDNPNPSDLEKLSKLAGDAMLPSDKARFSIGRETRHFKDDADAEAFWRNQKENWKQFGDGMERAKPKADFLKEGGVNVEFTNFDAPVPIKSGEDANTLMKAIGWDNVPSMGYAGHTLDRGNGRLWDVTTNTDNIRSRFAAFDPWRRNAAIASAMGVAAPDLLAAENPDSTRSLKDLIPK